MNRFLIEVRIGSIWMPYKLIKHCNDGRAAIDRLPNLVKDIEGGIENARVKRLVTNVQVSDAKINIGKMWGSKNLET
jgi:hypothetical protein